MARTMTEILFMSVFLGGTGYLVGKLFIRLNPFLMILGIFILLGLAPALVEFDNTYYTICFVLGAVLNFKQPLTYSLAFINDLFSSFQLKQARAGYSENIEEQKQQAEHELYRQKQQVEEELKRQKYEAEQDIARQRREAEETIKRQAENLKREKEKYQKSRNNSYENTKEHLNPLVFSDACKILGLPQGKTLKEYKKAYLQKMKLYHADRLAGLSDELRKQEEEKAKVLNMAMGTVRKNI